MCRIFLESIIQIPRAMYTLSICVCVSVCMYVYIYVTQHRERMLRGGTFLCSMLNIWGDMTKFSQISEKNILYQLFV